MYDPSITSTFDFQSADFEISQIYQYYQTKTTRTRMQDYCDLVFYESIQDKTSNNRDRQMLINKTRRFAYLANQLWTL